MAEGPTRSATPAVLMELREERAVVQEGYRFLDEKRLLLAAETLRQLSLYRETHRRYEEAHRTAALALADAVERHGVEALQLFPPLGREVRVATRSRNFLGVTLSESDGEVEESEPLEAIDPSAEAKRCAEAFLAMTVIAASLASITGNLERLLTEYRRTARRARALEDVILPELEEAIAEIRNRLEESDQEEAVRVRLKRSPEG